MFVYPDGDCPLRAVASMQRGATRSSSPRQHNRPTSLEAFYRLNDVEFFDRETDPPEVRNLATDRKRSGDVVLAMNHKLNRLIDAEVGEDRGQMLRGGIAVGWEVTAETMAP